MDTGGEESSAYHGTNERMMFGRKNDFKFENLLGGREKRAEPSAAIVFRVSHDSSSNDESRVCAEKSLNSIVDSTVVSACTCCLTKYLQKANSSSLELRVELLPGRLHLDGADR
jgi:hypothetical protein